MAGVAAQPAPSRSGGLSWIWNRQLDAYPDTRPRVLYLAITVLATITLYYQLYVGGSVTTLYLVNLHMSFTFFSLTVAFGALIGAFGSLGAGLGDRLGRANMVVFGLLFPATTPWRSCSRCWRSASASPTPRGWPAKPRPWRRATRR
jgi:hypothetical protein